MNWRSLALIGLFAVALGGYFVWRQHPVELPGLTSAPPPPPKPGYFMNDAHVVQTGADGLPLYRVDAERIRQNPNDMTIRLENMHLDYYPRTNTGRTNTGRTSTEASSPERPIHWVLTAKTGLMPEDAKRIELQEGVEIRGQSMDSARAAATIRTSKLSVDIETETARTRERVDIAWGTRQLSATGMTVDMKAQRVKLESSIHGQFVR